MMMLNQLPHRMVVVDDMRMLIDHPWHHAPDVLQLEDARVTMIMIIILTLKKNHEYSHDAYIYK
jgi:hypothetical protein